MARKRRTVKRAQPAIRKDDDSKLFAWLATFFLIIGFIIALVTKKDNKYVMFYAKQSLVIFIAWIILGIGAAILSFIPIIGGIIRIAVNILVFVLWLLSWIYALSGEEKEVPIVGQYGKSFNF